eukprot:14266-Prymnesium_polylepis.1
MWCVRVYTTWRGARATSSHLEKSSTCTGPWSQLLVLFRIPSSRTAGDAPVTQQRKCHCNSKGIWALRHLVELSKAVIKRRFSMDLP